MTSDNNIRKTKHVLMKANVYSGLEAIPYLIILGKYKMSESLFFINWIWHGHNSKLNYFFFGGGH